MVTISRGAVKVDITIEGLEYGQDYIEFKCRNSISISINAVHPDFIQHIKKTGRKKLEEGNATIDFARNNIKFNRTLKSGQTAKKSGPAKLDEVTGMTQEPQGAVHKVKNLKTSQKKEETTETPKSETAN